MVEFTHPLTAYASPASKIDALTTPYNLLTTTGYKPAPLNVEVELDAIARFGIEISLDGEPRFPAGGPGCEDCSELLYFNFHRNHRFAGRPLWLKAQGARVIRNRRVSKHLAGIEDVVGVQKPLDALHEGDLPRPDKFAQVFFFRQADPVLPGDHAAPAPGVFVELIP